jgi:SAM-dependent methyltransferase
MTDQETWSELYVNWRDHVRCEIEILKKTKSEFVYGDFKALDVIHMGKN